MSRKNDYTVKLVIATLMTGLCAGLGGILINLALKLVEKIAYGTTDEDTNRLFALVPPSHRFWSVLLTFILAAAIWYWLQSSSRRLYSIKAQVNNADDESS